MALPQEADLISIESLQRENAELRRQLSDGYMSLRETAQFVHLSVDRLYQLTSQSMSGRSGKKIPVYKPCGRLLFKRSEVVAWIEGKSKPQMRVS